MMLKFENFQHAKNRRFLSMKKYLIPLILISVLVIVGCEKAEVKKTDFENPFMGGSQGLIASFEMMGVPGADGEEIYEDETFPIEVILKNKGEHTIPSNGVVVMLKGIPLTDFTGIKGMVLNSEEMEGISDINPDGGEIALNFKSGTEDPKYNVPITGTKYTINFIADVRYDYETRAIAPSVCFKENLRDDTVCDVEGTKDVFSSAAPLQVTSLTQKPSGAGKIALEFAIENKGAGKIAKPETDFDPQRDVTAFRLYPEEVAAKWDCKAGGRSGEARLDAGKAVIRCRLIDPLQSGTLYTQAINLVLEYQYQESISKSLTILSKD